MLVPLSIETPNLSKMGVDDFRWTDYEFIIWYYFRLHIHGELLSISFIFFCFTLCDFAATIVPIKGTFLSDGMQFLILIKDDEKAKQHLYNIQVSSELFSYKRPKDWDKRLIEISEEKLKEDKSIRDIMSGLMLVLMLEPIKKEWKERYHI